MTASIIIGLVIFGYAAGAFVKFIKKAKKGKCAACSMNKSCSSNCSMSAK